MTNTKTSSPPKAHSQCDQLDWKYTETGAVALAENGQCYQVFSHGGGFAFQHHDLTVYQTIEDAIGFAEAFYRIYGCRRSTSSVPHAQKFVPVDCEGCAPDTLETLKAIRDKIKWLHDYSDAWWITYPDCGGFDLELIETAIAKMQSTPAPESDLRVDREALIIKHLTVLYGIQAVSTVMAAVNAEAFRSMSDVLEAEGRE